MDWDCKLQQLCLENHQHQYIISTKKFHNTADGRNPVNNLECIKPCKYWEDFFHQQYQYHNVDNHVAVSVVSFVRRLSFNSQAQAFSHHSLSAPSPSTSLPRPDSRQVPVHFLCSCVLISIGIDGRICEILNFSPQHLMVICWDLASFRISMHSFVRVH